MVYLIVYGGAGGGAGAGGYGGAGRGGTGGTLLKKQKKILILN